MSHHTPESLAATHTAVARNDAQRNLTTAITALVKADATYARIFTQRGPRMAEMSPAYQRRIDAENTVLTAARAWAYANGH